MSDKQGPGDPPIESAVDIDQFPSTYFQYSEKFSLLEREEDLEDLVCRWGWMVMSRWYEKNLFLRVQ